uniref:Uncharacterized protein n=1 Tax=Latimeria chalumnae TaxID=7897 RepID=H2ZVT1_LATCH
VSPIKFVLAIKQMGIANSVIDLRYALSEERHFDSETFVKGKAVILEGRSNVILNIQKGNYWKARQTFGEILHTLQDFYSHSNWIELGYRIPNTKLIKPDEDVGNIADKDQETCKSCSDKCENNLLEDMLGNRLLTSGYFSLYSSSKPKGKCSHGGFFDRTSYTAPKGGINKDSTSSPHSHLHQTAVTVAINATIEALEDIRDAVGDQLFLKMEGKSLTGVGVGGCVKKNSKTDHFFSLELGVTGNKTPHLPSSFESPTFSSPSSPELCVLESFELFWIKNLFIFQIMFSGALSSPSLCFIGLVMALINTPEFTDIYVFTDASTKDTYLQNAIIALIENTKSTVTFFITNPFGRRKRNSQRLRHQRSLTRDELYQKIAFTSGGQTIFTSKTPLENASSIITDTTSSALVTLLYTQSNSLNVENVFSFYVDVSLRNVTVYISGKIDTVKISNPKGVTQLSSVALGALSKIEQMESFCRIQLLPNMELGEWQVRIHSGQKYTVKITGQSMVDFSYYFAEKFSGPHPGFAELNGRPATGRNVSMVFSITGLTLYKSFSFTDVFFMDALGRILQTTSLQTTGTADTFLANSSAMLSIAVLIQTASKIQSLICLSFKVYNSPACSENKEKRNRVNESSAFEPGKEHAVFFNLENNGPPMTFHIRVWNDQNYTMSSNLSSVDLGFNATKQGSLILLAPSGTESGTIVTLSIEAESSDQSDFNFALVQLTVAEKVEDFSAPKCSIIAMNKNCATHCSIQQWHLTVEFQETGTGIERIYVRYGNGTLITKEATVMGTSVTQVNYTASCCTQDVEIIGVDKVGNVGKCEVS